MKSEYYLACCSCDGFCQIIHHEPQKPEYCPFCGEKQEEEEI